MNLATNQAGVIDRDRRPKRTDHGGSPTAGGAAGKKDHSMMKFENSVLINRPPEQVFAYVTDIKNNTVWQTDILELEMTSEGPFGLGSTYRCVNRFMGKRLETEGRVTDYEPYQRCCIRITSGDVRGTTGLFFETVESGTRFTTTGELELTFFRLAGLLVKRKIKSQLKTDMLKLKAVLENGDNPRFDMGIT